MYHTPDYRTPTEQARDAFTRAVGDELRLRHVPFDLRELQEFIAGMWPLVLDGEGPRWWAEAFVENATGKAVGGGAIVV